MGYRIVVDSCCDLAEELHSDKIVVVPLTLEVDGETFIDDETFNQNVFIKKVAESSKGAKSACPSPQLYADAYDCGEEDIYVVTLSGNLSGSYNSARVGAQMFLERYPNRHIHVFDSCSASAGETLLAIKIMEFAEGGMSFREVVQKASEYRDAMDTYFVIDSLETLRKNGRLTGLTAVIATVLNIKPVMGSTDIGTIQKLDQARGMNRAINRMVELIAEKTVNPKEKILCITHVNCPERADKVRRIFEAMQKFKKVVVSSAGGVSTCYANDGGIVIAV